MRKPNCRMGPIPCGFSLCRWLRLCGMVRRLVGWLIEQRTFSSYRHRFPRPPARRTFRPPALSTLPDSGGWIRGHSAFSKRFFLQCCTAQAPQTPHGAAPGDNGRRTWRVAACKIATTYASCTDFAPRYSIACPNLPLKLHLPPVLPPC